MRFRSLVQLVFVGALAAAGCSSSSESSSSTSAGKLVTTTTAAQNVSVSPYLLEINEMPSGWSTLAPPETTTESCYSFPLAKVPSLSHDHVNYSKTGNVPAFSEELAYFSSGKSAFATISDTLNNCHTFALSAEGRSGTGTSGQMSFPKTGEQSQAYLANITIQGVRFTDETVLAQKGNFLVLVSLADLGPVDSVSLENLVNLAMAKIPSAFPH